MNPNLDKLYAEQEAKIQILEFENDMLSEKAEENQLLRMAFEEINAHEDSKTLFDNILENISILLDIQYSGIFEQHEKQFINVCSYALFNDEDTSTAMLELSEQIQRELLSCKSVFVENNKQYSFKCPNSTFVASELLIVPVCAKPVADRFFIFANNDKSETLQKRTGLLERISRIVSFKLERFFYQEELKKLNKGLEQRVKDRTKELSVLNEKLVKEIQDKNKAEQELKKSEAKFKAIFEYSPLGLFYYNSKGVILNCNSNFVDIIGSSKKALIGLDMIKRLPDKKLVAALKKSLLAGTGIYRGYYKSVTSGKITPVRVVFGGVKDKNKKIIGGIGIVEDITIQKKAEDEINAANEELIATTDALRESNNELTNALKKVVSSETKFKQLSNLTFEGIVIHNKGIVVDVNLSFTKMVGYKRSEIIGKNIITLLVHKKNQKKVSKNISENVVLPYEVEGIRKDGSTFPAEIQAKEISDNGNKLRVAAIRDISLRKKTETQIKKLSSAVEQSANTIVITDIKGNIEYVNPKFTETTGYTTQEAIGKNPRILNTGTQAKEYYAKMWEEISTGQKWTGEFHNMKKNGDFFWEQVTITPIKNEDGTIVNYLAIKEDITARKKAESELKLALRKAEESDHLKTEFLHNMSHEIRTPLNGILGYSNLLNSNNLTSEKTAQFTKIIQNSGEKLLRIIDDILEISELATKQLKVYRKEVRLNDLLNELHLKFMPLAQKKQIELFVEKSLPDGDSKLITDKSKLEKILCNLLENALKFTKTGSIRFGYVKPSEAKKTNLRLYVKDTGIGIKPDMQESIFKWFSQEEKEISQKVGGLGLGLSIAKELVTLLGGAISITSEKGKGTSFFIDIPYKHMLP